MSDDSTLLTADSQIEPTHAVSAEFDVAGRPIFRQLRDRVVAMILDGSLREGDALPSVRVVAADSRVNPLTVLKAYQSLVDDGLVESRRGRGMFVNAGAKEALLRVERERFLGDEWPKLRAKITRLGLSASDLLNSTDGSNPK